MTKIQLFSYSMNINTHSCDNCARNCCLLPVQSLANLWLYSLRVSCDILTLITHTHAPWHNSIYSTSSLSLFCLTVHPLSLTTTASPTLTRYLPHRLHLLPSSPLPTSSSTLMLKSAPCLLVPPPSVADRMTMPVLIRARMARCSTRLSTGLWERVLLILASGDGLKMTGPKTSKHCLVTFTYSTRTGTQVIACNI